VAAPRDHGAPVRVAVACQGGGSHTAFTAGVLKRLLGADELSGYHVVGLSGTSGGAVCAFLAWYALRDNNPIRAGQLLEQFWTDNSARGPVDMVVNAWVLWASTLQNFGVMPALSPYSSPVAEAAADQFRQMLRRRVDFDRIDIDTAAEYPALLLGAVDVLSGRFRAFNSRRDLITPDSVLASAAIPNLFRAVHLEGGTYWDGLFSQNPPVRDLLDVEPDELWVIQINPQRRDTEPTTLLEIADRRNELAGNLSLYQELAFIETIDRLLASGQLNPGAKYKQIVVRVIEVSRTSLPGHLGAVSKLNRDPVFLRDLMVHGEEQAEEFLAALGFERAWQSHDVDKVMKLFADNAELVSAPPFPEHHAQGTESVRQFVQKHLSRDLQVDLSHKQVAREQVTWSIRARSSQTGIDVEGQAEAEFEGGKVASIHLRALPPSP
jgi:NTE family protein